jgi:hypothetical protein
VEPSKTFLLIRVLIYVSLWLMTREQAIRKRDSLLARLPEACNVLRGSLLERNIRHSQGCAKCERGGGHPVSVLAVGYPGGRIRHISLHREQVAEVKQALGNYQSLKAAIEEICELNQQLLRLEPKSSKPARRSR